MFPLIGILIILMASSFGPLTQREGNDHYFPIKTSNN